MSDHVPESIRELFWRSQLTQSERERLAAWLARHPEAADDLELERLVTRSMDHLPDAPVPSNFTARILQQLDRSEAPADPPLRSTFFDWLRSLGWRPQAALATVVLVVGLLGWHQHRVNQRAELARAMVESVVVLPAEAVEDFDLIQDLGAGPDLKLLAALE